MTEKPRHGRPNASSWHVGAAGGRTTRQDVQTSWSRASALSGRRGGGRAVRAVAPVTSGTWHLSSSQCGAAQHGNARLPLHRHGLRETGFSEALCAVLMWLWRARMQFLPANLPVQSSC
jgi:hypothetical protein